MSGIRKAVAREWFRLSTMLRLLCGASLSDVMPTPSPTPFNEVYLDSDSTTLDTPQRLSSFNAVSISIESGLSWVMQTQEQPDGTRTLRLTISAPR